MCKKFGCTCSDTRNIKGDKGEQGEQGEQGVSGSDGASGLSYEFFYSLNDDDTDLGNPTETVLSGTTRTIAGGTGDYQVAVSFQGTGLTGLIEGEVRLYINGVLVNKAVIDHTFTDTSTFDKTIFWRGAIANGDDVEVRTIRTGAINAVSSNYSILINKEL